MIKIESNAKDFKNKIKGIAEIIAYNTPKYIAMALSKQINFIRTRVEWGYDIEGNSMPFNSEKYGEKKRKVVGHTQSAVLSGSMLDAIIFEMTGSKSGRIFFSNRYLPGAVDIYEKMDSEMIPHAEKVEELESLGYTFFGITEKESDLLQDYVGSLIYEDVKHVLQ